MLQNLLTNAVGGSSADSIRPQTLRDAAEWVAAATVYLPPPLSPFKYTSPFQFLSDSQFNLITVGLISICRYLLIVASLFVVPVRTSPSL